MTLRGAGRRACVIRRLHRGPHPNRLGIEVSNFGPVDEDEDAGQTLTCADGGPIRAAVSPGGIRPDKVAGGCIVIDPSNGVRALCGKHNIAIVHVHRAIMFSRQLFWKAI